METAQMWLMSFLTDTANRKQTRTLTDAKLTQCCGNLILTIMEFTPECFQGFQQVTKTEEEQQDNSAGLLLFLVLSEGPVNDVLFCLLRPFSFSSCQPRPSSPTLSSSSSSPSSVIHPSGPS